jgi:Tfp pilus assembly protein PilF
MKPRAQRNLGAAYLAEGRIEEASASIERALELSPKYPAARMTQREIDRRRGLRPQRRRNRQSDPNSEP